jgi:short-chain fatty acids transporter
MAGAVPIHRPGRRGVCRALLDGQLALSWSFSLIFSGLLAREVANRVKTADYRAIGAAAYLGVGSVWALGLSSSAALIMASSASLPDSVEAISGVIPLSQTLGLWQSLTIAGVLILASMVVSYYSAPPPEHAKSMADMGVAYERVSHDIGVQRTPGEYLEYSPLLTIVLSLLGIGYLAKEVSVNGAGILLQLNQYIFTFLVVGLLLHWRPKSFVQAIGAAITPIAGVLIQYPMYAGIVKMLTASGLATQMAHFFVSISTSHTYPVMIGIYSAFLGLFIPSAGGKWLIEAPYMLEAAKSLNVHLGWVVQTYKRHRGAGQPDSSLLDAAARRHPGPEGPRHRGLLDAAVRGTRAAGVVAGLGPQLHFDLHTAGAALASSTVPERLVKDIHQAKTYG